MKAARIYLSVLCLTLGFLYGFSPAEKKSKATWIWQSETVGENKQQVLTFCEENDITLIYLRIDMNKPYDFYRSFIRDASAKGVEVHAVAGHPAWALVSNQKRMLKIVNWVKQYNESVAQAERVKGIQLDIEPYLLPQWETEQERVIREWQSNVKVFAAELNEIGNLEASVAIPFWLDDIPTPDNPDLPLSEWMISRFDTINIMAYRDKLDGPNGLLSLVDEEMEQADKLERRVLIAVNMKEIEDDHASFAQEGADEMNRMLDQLPDRLGEHPSYSGTAIHDYRYWQEASGTIPAPPPAPSQYRGTYIWRAETLKSEEDEILAFAEANEINLLYIRIDMQQPPAMYQRFLKKATAAGIEVHALGGHPIWALEENRSKILKLVNWVKAYNAQAGSDEQLRGVHLDIEPYVLPRWQENKEEVLRQWMGNIESFVAEAKKDGLETSVDLAAWLDNTAVPGNPDVPFSHWMIDQLDHTTLMAFRDKAERIVNLVESQMKYAESKGKKLVVAVETKESHEGEFVTFFEEGMGEMNQQLQLVAQLLGGYSSYLGQAVHAYEYWKNGKD
ncbi:hypothetical protein P4V54_11645 [Brevibacillus nitrificans]|uniref:hypothetical protein n=1 Tax=Brevibacillus nitrificans TaxID=651560 RepID=UPI002E221E5F|nr:hypothetical protein [Brevibacillus nitrificans]